MINLRHPVARQIVMFLDAVTRPILRPIQRIIPPLGGFDISPIIAIIILQAAEQYLVPWVFGFVRPVLG